VLPISDVIRDSAVQLVLTHQRGAGSGGRVECERDESSAARAYHATTSRTAIRKTVPVIRAPSPDHINRAEEFKMSS
jgi:hypothetical protein